MSPVINKSRRRLLLLFAAAVGVGLLVPQLAFVGTCHGLDCATNSARLTLVEVTEDGAPVSDLAAYQGAEVQLWARESGAVEITARPQPAGGSFWSESYHVATAE